MTSLSSFEIGARRAHGSTAGRTGIRLSTGLGLILAAALSGLLWAPVVMAAHAAIA